MTQAEGFGNAGNGGEETEVSTATFDLSAHLQRQREFSRNTFGPGARTKGVLDHIRKELAEIEADPKDISEWVDVIILAFDGAWRAGWEPDQIIAAIVAKQGKNEARTWPDWRTSAPDRAIEHDRSKDRRSCNRHDDCNEADQQYMIVHATPFTPPNFHCHNDECEDCFGA